MDALGIGIPHHVQSFFARLRDHATIHDRPRISLEDVSLVYRSELLGPSGQIDLAHVGRETVALDPELAAELRATHADLAGRWRDSALPDHARAAVLHAADRLGRRLVLMLENLQSLARNADPDFGWQLRGVLQSLPEIVLIASATARFDDIDDPSEPFFELFRLLDLKPLDTEECATLWTTVRNEPVSELTIRPLQILTGGSPRFLVIVARFADHLSLRQLMEELVTLVDDHTEYFRGHLEVLPKGERRVFVALLDLWTPSTAAEIAARARADVRTVSTMLGRLIDRGSVVVNPPATGRSRLYAAAEPLYNIYYKLRRERDEAAVVEGLIRFMVALYDPHVFFHWQRQLTAEHVDSPSLLAGLQRALDSCFDPPTDFATDMKRSSLENAATNAAAGRRLDAQLLLQNEVKEATDTGAWQSMLGAVDRFLAACGPGDYPMRDHDAVNVAHIRAVAHQHLGDFAKVIDIADDVLVRFRDSRDVFVLYQAAQILLNKAAAQHNLGEHRATIATALDFVAWFDPPLLSDDTQYAPLFAQLFHLKALSHQALGEKDTAIQILNNIFERFGVQSGDDLAKVLVHILADHAELTRNTDPQRAVALYDAAAAKLEAVEPPGLAEVAATVYLNRAFAKAGLGDFEGEVASYRALVALADAHAKPARGQLIMALALLGLRLAELGRVREAATVSERLISHPDSRRIAPPVLWWVDWIAIISEASRGDFNASLARLRTTCERFRPGDDFTTRLTIRLAINLVALGTPAGDLADTLDAELAGAGIAPLTTALRIHAGRPVRAPAEVMQIASDLGERLAGASNGELMPF